METDTETKLESGSVPYTELGRSELEPEEMWVMQKEEENEERENVDITLMLGRREEEDRQMGAIEEDSRDSGSFSPEENRDALSSGVSIEEGELEEERMEWEKREERRSLETDGASSSTGSLSSREDNGEVFDISSAEKMVTPARPRNTEDLFAARHSSAVWEGTHV
ncbi:uncharacterized protein LOC121847744 isoform X2 [Oncorhynchus tshawytscha]|nr:uncharacterized protein LOC121847744 isoform X2 [Oncorhynchus tshawytscha]